MLTPMKEEVFLKQMRLLNRHLASSKKDLAALLREGQPRVTLKDGSAHHFNAEELKLIANVLPEKLHKSLKLPVFIELSSSKYGPGTARVSGRAECALVSSILKKELGEEEMEMFIYRPEVRELRKRLKTTTQYMFTTSLDF